ncbi:hypothetical protein C8Q78DRAFT_1074953 [Trametes maxima]|nr:hypothetical protein C8Q78DRAFT_1074953 [Trametes maxima]
MNPAVPLPNIPGEASLQVFIHPTGAVPDQGDPTYGTAEQLGMIGKSILMAVYIDALCDLHPPMPDVQMLRDVDEALENRVFEWAESYSLLTRMHGVPLDRIDMIVENRRLFHAYVGAVFKSPYGGYPAVRQWIGALLGLQSSLPAQVPLPLPHQGVHLPAGGYGSSGGAPGVYSNYQPPPYLSTAGPVPPGPPPLAGAPSPPTSPSKPIPTYLPYLNQIAQKKRLQLQFTAQYAGKPHTPDWTAECMIDGVRKGTGSGASKQEAREQAARDACFAMGLAPGGEQFREFR